MVWYDFQTQKGFVCLSSPTTTPSLHTHTNTHICPCTRELSLLACWHKLPNWRSISVLDDFVPYKKHKLPLKEKQSLTCACRRQYKVTERALDQERKDLLGFWYSWMPFFLFCNPRFHLSSLTHNDRMVFKPFIHAANFNRPLTKVRCCFKCRGHSCE